MSQVSFGARAPYALPPLPYGETELEPVISARTLGFHHGRHHQGYLTTLNRLLAGDPLGALPLVRVIRETAEDPARTAIFDNAAQVWNHSFYWYCLRRGGGGQPAGRLAALIDRSFGSFAAFQQRFAAAAMSQFGSGWAWLCEEGGRLLVLRTANAETPIAFAGINPLLTIDVWEHAYYLDYQNRRADHVNAVIGQLLNWQFAELNLPPENPAQPAMVAALPQTASPLAYFDPRVSPGATTGSYLSRLARRL
ncbi:MAG: superoxide dismutase [Fe] [Azospirillum sp.]|nr:superoxide dismutase [Fe] [Azospirillum sp.]